jgi:hypothetical protein
MNLGVLYLVSFLGLDKFKAANFRPCLLTVNRLLRALATKLSDSGTSSPNRIINAPIVLLSICTRPSVNSDYSCVFSHGSQSRDHQLTCHSCIYSHSLDICLSDLFCHIIQALSTKVQIDFETRFIHELKCQNYTSVSFN